MLPGTLKSEDGDRDFYLASLEGKSAEYFASLITGIDVENVVITGEGAIGGNASFEILGNMNQSEEDSMASTQLYF